MTPQRWFARPWLVTLLCLGVALLLYARSLGYGWTFDDWIVIVDNPDVTSLSAFWADSYPGRPLRELSFLLDHLLFGMNPGPWHLQSILLHGLCAALLWRLVLQLGGRVASAWLVAGLFLLHPLNVEAVASISHRKDLLALFFCLAALWCYLQSFRPAVSAWRWRIATLLFWGVALLAKQNALVLPLVLGAVEVATLPAEQRLLCRRPRWLAGAALVATSAALGWLLLAGGWAEYRETARLFLTRWHYYGADAATLYPLMVLKSWAFMGVRLVWPWPLAVEYNYPVPTALLDPWVLAGAALTLAWLAALWSAFHRARLVWFGLVWFGLFWLPTSNLWPLAYLAADRYFYLPAVGLFLALAALPETVWRSWALRVAVVGVCTLYAVVTTVQLPVWRDDETLFLYALKVSPHSAYICNELGKLYQKRGEPATALGYYLRGTAANPRAASLPYNLGTLYESLGFKEQALDYYRQFLRLEPSGEYIAAAVALRERLQRQYGVVLP